MTLTCLDCPFRGDFSDAVTHYDRTQHRLLYHGVVQELASAVRARARVSADREAYDAAMRRDPTWHDDDAA